MRVLLAVASLGIVGLIQPGTPTLAAPPPDLAVESAVMECSALPAGGEDCCIYPDESKLQPYELEGVKWCAGECKAQAS